MFTHPVDKICILSTWWMGGGEGDWTLWEDQIQICSIISTRIIWSFSFTFTSPFFCYIYSTGTSYFSMSIFMSNLFVQSLFYIIPHILLNLALFNLYPYSYAFYSMSLHNVLPIIRHLNSLLLPSLFFFPLHIPPPSLSSYFSLLIF